MEILLPSSQALDRALAILQKGEVIAHATETCYGLACDLTNPDAVQRLFAIKQRPLDQPVSALFASIEEAKKYVQWNAEADVLAKKYLPGPLTLILLIRSDPPHILLPNPNPNPSLGIRISSHPLTQQLVKMFGKPISTTSANVHGQSNPYSAGDIRSQFEGRVQQPNLVLDSGALPHTSPSTVIDLSGKSLRQRRQGGIELSGSTKT